MKLSIKALLVGAFSTFGAPALAGEYPDHSVNIVFPNKAGSGYHTILLAVLDAMKDQLPESVSVTPMPGAGTATGNRYVQSQPDDGYTLLFIHEALFTSSALGMLNFNPLEEFEAVARVVTSCGALYASADEPFDDLAGMVSFDKENPGKLRASINTGAISHVEVLSIMNMTGSDLIPVHVAGGTAGFSQAALAGDVDLISAAPSGVVGLVESGDLKPLVYYGPERSPAIPDTPTLKELGYDQQDVCIGGYLWIRKSAPEEAKAFWESAVKKTLTSDVAQQLTERLQANIGFVGRDDLAEVMPAKFKEWTGMMKAAGVGQ